MKRWIFSCFCLLTSWLSVTAEVMLVLSPGPGAATAGDAAEVVLVAVNVTARETAIEAPDSLLATLYWGNHEWATVLRGEGDRWGAVPAGGDFRRVYRFNLPPEVAGEVLLQTQLPGGELLRTLVPVAAAPRRRSVPAPVEPDSVDPAQSPERREVAGPPRPASVGAGVESEEAADFRRSFIDRFGLHEPMYFAYGNEDLGAKFQISFKYRLFSLAAEPEAPPHRTLQLSYTQRSLWDIDSASSPFYDTSYMPGFFMEWTPRNLGAGDGWGHWTGLQTGIQHESNGQSGLDSRSLNTLFLRSSWALGELDDWHLVLVPEAWLYIGGLSDNEDIRDFRGYGQLRAVLGRAGGPALSYSGRVGRGFDHFTSQFDLTVPVDLKFIDFSTYFIIQYFNGYGENLLDYDERSTSVRFGISLVR